jgi:hypothetical protein
MLRRALLTALWSAACCTATAQETFLAQISEAAAVAPLRMPGPSQTNIMSGHFDGKRADAVIITDGDAKLCKGPDYKRCAPLGQLATARSVAVNRADGKSVILQFDSLSYGQVCTVDLHGQRASLDCRALDFNKLADYQAQRVGEVLVIDAVDGKYFCSETKRGVQCVQILQADGTVDRRTVGEQRKAGGKFSPADRPGKTCRVKRGEVDCADTLKHGELGDPFVPMSRLVLLIEDGDFNENPAFDGWERISLDRVQVTGSWGDYGATLLGGTYWWQTQVTNPAPPPRSAYQVCMSDCTDRDTRLVNACHVAAGVVLAATGKVPYASGAWLACQAARVIINDVCESRCFY